MRKAYQKRIFVVGCPRSGTTLLQKLLTNIPGSFSMPETYFFQLLVDNPYVISGRLLPPFLKLKYPKRVNPETAKRIIDFLRGDTNFKISTNSESDLIEKAENEKLEPAYFFDHLMHFYASNFNSDRILIEKTPVHTFHIPYIRSLFPDAIFLSIVRDPRDTYLSFNRMLAIQKKPKRTVAEFSHLWVKSIEYALKNNVDIVRYEDLIQNPLKIINEKIGKYGLAIQELKENTYPAIVRPGAAEKALSKVKLKVLSNNINLYKNHLSEKEIAEINCRCAKWMHYFHYQPDVGFKRNPIFTFQDTIKWQITKLVIWRNILFQTLKKIICLIFY